MRTITELWKSFYSELGQINPECPYKNVVVKKSMTTTAGYSDRAKVIVENIKSQYSILEIGCGYGGLAYEILKEKNVFYTVVDNEIMLIQAKKLLSDKVEYIEAGEIEKLKDRKFGLFISHYCLSETPPAYRKYILENIIKNCRQISVADLADEAKPTHKMKRNGYEILPLNIKESIEKYFIIETTELRKRTFMYIGERRR